MNREERIQEQMEDWQRGRDSMTIDAFRHAKEYTGGRFHHLSAEFRKQYKYWLDWCHRYYMKASNGARYSLCTIDDMVSYYKKQAIRRGL